MDELINELKAVLIYCQSARKSPVLSLCKLQLRDEIQPRVEKVLAELQELNGLLPFDKRGN